MKEAQDAHDELDRILSREEELLPSSGFAVAVMEGVRTEASAPPIPFPWKRALPGLAAAIVALALLAAWIATATSQSSAAPATLPAAWTANMVGIAAVVLALSLSYASMKIGMRLSRG